MVPAATVTAGSICRCRIGQYDVENIKVLAMQIAAQLSEPFIQACSRIRSARRIHFKDKAPLYIGREAGKLYVIKKGYVRLLYVQPDGRSWTRMVFGPAALVGDLPFRPGFFLSDEQAVSNGASCVFEIEREEVERNDRQICCPGGGTVSRMRDPGRRERGHQHEEQDEQRMQDTRDGAMRAGSDVGRRAGDRACHAHTAERDGGDVGDTLSQQLTIRTMLAPGHAVGHHGRKQALDGTKQSDRYRVGQSGLQLG